MLLNRTYIELELQLGAVDRARTLYSKFLEWAPAHCGAWCKFAELERSLGELDRARSIYELAIAQPVLDMPEVLWKVREGQLLRSAPAEHGATCRCMAGVLWRACWVLEGAEARLSGPSPGIHQRLFPHVPGSASHGACCSRVYEELAAFGR